MEKSIDLGHLSIHPIEDTLKKLVQMPDVRKEIESSHASNL